MLKIPLELIIFAYEMEVKLTVTVANNIQLHLLFKIFLHWLRACVDYSKILGTSSELYKYQSDSVHIRICMFEHVLLKLFTVLCIIYYVLY